ncbi:MULTISPECIES: DNA repair protein RadA [Hymenobacter]|uniref:DNA repair protein RadA n=1 Tax=Hymenobacter jejuensis TaxID=2502781 RepID=A0A5B7ZZ62_9BACT|nr:MULTISPECIES: DNA repair protein RadA [Hymenobacter]MBC6991808.1 DNA repair protein RadA [Hymenobacter sp. BT491]QDA60127.1 DNA repair protein RadA [Hymenobacter jejuensis]
MAKLKTLYFCQNCGAQSAKWIGRCPSCGEWNTYVEEVVQKENTQATGSWKPPTSSPGTKTVAKPRAIGEIHFEEEARINTQDAELNRVLGGGLVLGSLVLIGGEPGIGKSTLMLQIAMNLRQLKVLYVSGEESEQQIKMRAERLGPQHPDCYILTETNTQNIFKQIDQLQPNVVVIDSIQTLHSGLVESGAGSVSQVRECTAELLKYAKETGVPVLIIGHITKDGSIAGPKILEHMVDTVLQFEGDRHLSYRILRTTKNRFGSTSELGIYEMQGTGLRQVSNPSEILLSQRTDNLSGMAIGATLEGNRPLLVEVQALVTPATYGTPQRSSTGFDAKRLNMLLAVLEKRSGLRLGQHDVFLNIAGGLRLDDPALDVAVCAAVVSSLNDIPIPGEVCLASEVGLSGEIRAVSRLDQRLSEAEKLGFQEMYISQFNAKGLDLGRYGIRVHPVGRLDEVLSGLFG